MTLIPCSAGDGGKIFRPWDSAASPPVKHERLASSPAASTSSSSDESELSRISIGSPDHFAAAVHHAHLMPLPFAPHALAAAWYPPAPAPSIERFLASLESAPDALHPARLAALGMAPSDIGELYQLAGLRAVHPFAASSAGSSAQSSAKKQRPKRFRCPHCNVAFSNNGQLKGHVRSHTGNSSATHSKSTAAN